MVGPTRLVVPAAVGGRGLSPRRAPRSRARRRPRTPPQAATAPAGSWRVRPSRIEVNGTRISRKTSIETRNPANRKRTPRNLPSWNHSVIPNRLSVSPRVATNAPMAIRIVAGTRLWSLPANSARTAPGSDATRLTRDRDRRDEQVEQELVARLVRVERVGEDAPLGHEHVGREDGTEDQRERPGDVHERGQQPERRREQRRDGRPGRRIDRVARGRQRRGGHQDEAQQRRSDDRGGGQDRPAVVGEVGLDRDGQREQPGRDEVEQRQRAGARVFGLVADEEGEQAGQEEAQREAVAEPRPARAGTPSRGRASRPSRPRPSGTTSGRAPRSSRTPRRSPRSPAPTP